MISTYIVDYYKTLFEYPENFHKLFKEGSKIEIKIDEGLLICGMGGSAIAGDFIKELAAENFERPVIVVRGYRIPKYVNSAWTAIAVSYSGNTEETRTCVKQLRERGNTLYFVSSGGALKQVSEENNIPFFQIPKNLQPREAFYQMFGLLCGLLNSPLKLRITEEDLQALGHLRDILRESTNELEEIAKAQIGRQISILSSNQMGPIALRYRCQLNENAKLHAASFEVPEFSHNAIIGYDGKYCDNLYNIIIRSDLDDDRTKIHLDFHQDLIKETAVIRAQGSSRFQQFISTVARLDYVSIFSALHQGINPHSIDKINQLKAILRSK